MFFLLLLCFYKYYSSLSFVAIFQTGINRTCYLEIALPVGGRVKNVVSNAQGMRDRYVFILHILVATTQIARI